MGDTYKGSVKIVGISPMMMDAMSEEMVEKVLIRKQKQVIKTDLSREQMASAKLYRQDPEDPKSPIGLPAENVFACLREAGRFVAYAGKSKLSTKDSTVLPAFFSLDETFYVLDNQEWVPDVRRGQMQDQKRTAVGIVRPKFKEWSFTVNFTIEEDEGVTPALIKQLFEKAGRMIGLCSFRPANKGVFGRFAIEDWKVQKVALSDAA